MTGTIADHRIHPLRWGETLATHDWVELHLHRLLTSRMVAYAVAEGRRADLGTGLILWCESFRQDPAGSLPDDDVQLARLALFGSDLDGWRAARTGALAGWYPVHVEGEPGDPVPRLGHRLIGEIAARMIRRKVSRQQGRDGAAAALAKSRIRKKLMEMGLKRLAGQPDAVERIAAYLRDGSLWISVENLRAALTFIGVPRVVEGRFGAAGSEGED